jgi:hypothetical protein
MGFCSDETLKSRTVRGTIRCWLKTNCPVISGCDFRLELFLTGLLNLEPQIGDAANLTDPDQLLFAGAALPHEERELAKADSTARWSVKSVKSVIPHCS